MDRVDPLYVLNCYAKSGPQDVHDQFPVNTYIGTVGQVTSVLQTMFNSNAGIARVELVIDPSHPNATIGQAPQRLGELPGGTGFACHAFIEWAREAVGEWDGTCNADLLELIRGKFGQTIISFYGLGPDTDTMRQLVQARTFFEAEKEETAKQGAERDRLREALTWTVGFIQCNLSKMCEEYPDFHNARDLMNKSGALYSGEFQRARLAAEQTEDTATYLRDALAHLQGEVSAVLTAMDELAAVWGDEGVFRRCRDRLRAAIEDEPAGSDPRGT